jgi:phosphoribosylformylglycinamidine (FGAM) synthase-like enzyme
VEELRIEETAVATVGAHRIALAKCWEEGAGDTKKRIAWLSVATKGVAGSARDLELPLGGTFELDGQTWEIAAITLATPEDAAFVTLRPKR